MSELFQTYAGGSASASSNGSQQKQQQEQDIPVFGFHVRNESSEEEKNVEFARRRKRTVRDRDSSDDDSIDYQISAFTDKRIEEGNCYRYTVTDIECREHEVTLKQVNKLALKDKDTMAMFVEFLGGQKCYQDLFGKSPKQSKVEVPLILGKRQRTTRATQRQIQDEEMVLSEDDEESEEQPTRKNNAKKKRPAKKVLSSESEKVADSDHDDSQENKQKYKPKKQIKAAVQRTVEKAPEGNLEMHTPRLIRSLHGIRQTKKNAEIMCTVEWRYDDSQKYLPSDSQVSYAEMRKGYPLLVCDYFERHLSLI